MDIQLNVFLIVYSLYNFVINAVIMITDDEYYTIKVQIDNVNYKYLL